MRSALEGGGGSWKSGCSKGVSVNFIDRNVDNRGKGCKYPKFL